jgi:uncharacterized membrane protein YdjX (TVP38/TMEM64 family)
MSSSHHLNYKKIPGFLCLLFGLIALVSITIHYTPFFAKYLKDPVRLGEYIKSFGSKGVIVFIGFQIAQVVIAALPGEITQLAGGFLYGTFAGTALSYLGITIGMMIAFFFVRLFGMPAVKICLSEQQMEKFKFVVARPNAELLIVILFLIPGIPKDVLTYLAGLTPLNPFRFLLLASIARIPGIFLSSYIGAHLGKQRYVEAIVASVLAAIFFVVGLLFKEKITKHIKKC